MYSKERLKRKRKAAYEIRLEKEEKRRLLHQEIDAWQKQIHEKIQEQKVVKGWHIIIFVGMCGANNFMYLCVCV